MFVISIHPLGTKSSFSPISEAIDHSGDAYLQGLCRETSAIGFDMHTAWTEQELKTLYKRTKTLRQVIEKEIENLSDDDAEVYKTKLYRYRKFFANREFSLRFNIENKDRATELLNFFSKINQHSPNKSKMLEEFFIYFNENNLEMVFRSTFTSCVQEREDTLPEIDKQYRKLNTLLYGPHLSHSYLLKARASYNLENDSQIYTSLIRCTKHLSERYTTLPIDEKKRCIENLAVKNNFKTILP